QHTTFYTDQYIVYEKVIPAAQHQAMSKLARKTNHIERFNNTLRQRVSRLVRAALSFSKKLVNHIGTIKLFAQFIVGCSSSILAETLGYTASFSSPWRGKQHVLEQHKTLFIDQL